MDLSELVSLSMKRDGGSGGLRAERRSRYRCGLPPPGATTNTDAAATGGGVGDPATEEPPKQV